MFHVESGFHSTRYWKPKLPLWLLLWLVVGQTVAPRVVGVTDEAVLLLTSEAVEVEVAVVAVVRAVGSVCSSEEAFLLVLLDGEVEDGPLVAVVDARDAGHVALPVVGLHLIDDFSGHVLQDHVAVVAEELLTIDEYLTDGLAVEREASVLVLHDAGQLHHRHLRQLAFHDGLRHHRRVFAHHDVGHLEVARLLGQRQLELLHLVAHERHLQRVCGRRDAGQQELAVLLRRGAGYHRVALVV